MAAKYLLSNSSESHPGSSGIPPPPTSGGSRESSASSVTSSGSHRNRQLLKSYHDFAMHVFSNNKATQEAERLFLAAVREGDYERVENFLKRRNHEVVDIDVKDFSSGDTPLIAACRNGFTKVVQLLLKFGADTTLRNYEGETAVSVASIPIRKLLLESVERTGCSHRHLLQAAWQGNVTIVQRLLKEGKFLDINCENADGFTPLLLVTRDIMVFEKVKSALKDYSPDGVVKVLLAQRADPTMSDSEGKTAMHYAAACPSVVGHQITVMLMKDKELMVAQDENCVAPIHVASRHGQVDIVVALLDKGVDINSRGHAGATPLHVSALAGQLNVANTLLDRGADVTLVDDRGNTPMDVAHGKKMRTKLKEAWTEVIHNRRGSTPALSPVKPPSRKDHRRHSSSEDISPRDKEPPMSLTTNRVLQKLKDAHQALLNENQVLKDIDNGRFTPSSLTSTKMNLQKQSRRRCVSPSKHPAPPKTPRSGEDHTNLNSGAQKSRRTLSHDDKTLTSKAQGVKGHQKLGFSYSDPVKGNRRCDKEAIPVAVVGLDWDENVQDIRYGRVNQGRQLLQKGVPPTSDIPKRLTIDITSNPSLQQVTDICAGYLKKGSKPSLSNERDSQQALPEVSPNRPLSGAYRSVFLEGNLIQRATPSPFMERLHGFLGTALPPQGHLTREDVITDCDEERRKTLSVMSVDSPTSPRRSMFANSPFTGSTEVEPGPMQQRSGPLAAASTFNIEMSRVNQLKESSDSGQGSSRSTNSRASTISTPSPLLGDIEGSPSRHQVGLKRSLHLQSIDGDSAVHLPSLGKDRRTERIQPFEDRNFRVINNHQRHMSDDAMSVVSVSSSITAKTADICGQRISLSHTLKEESEVVSSPEQSLRDPGKMRELVHSQIDGGKVKDHVNSQMESQKMKRAVSEMEEKKGAIASRIKEVDESKEMTGASERVTALGNVTNEEHLRNITSSHPIKSNNLKDSVKPEGREEVKCQNKGNEFVETKVANKSTNQLKQIHSNNQGVGCKKDRKTANIKDFQNSDKLNRNIPGKEISKQLPSGVNVEGKGQQIVQPKKTEDMNKLKKVTENKMEKLPTEKTGKQRSDNVSVSTSDSSDKGKTMKNKEEIVNLNVGNDQKVQDKFVSKAGKSTLSKVEPSVQKPVQTTGIAEKQVQEKVSLQKANSRAPPVTKQPIKTSYSGKDNSAIGSKKVGQSEVSSQNKVTDKNTALNKNRQSGGRDVVKAASQGQGGSSSSGGLLDKSGVKGDSGVTQKVEKKENGRVTHKDEKNEKDSVKKVIVSTGERKNGEMSSRSEKSKIPKRNENMEDLKQKGNIPVNKSKENTPKLPQQNTPRGRKTPLPIAKTTSKKIESNRSGTTAGEPLIQDKSEERNSGKSQGTRSTPTDVTSDLTSDLHSRDSDSMESIEEVLDEVAFSSGSENEENKVTETKSEKKPGKPLVIIGGQSHNTLLDPAVVITKSEDNRLKKKSTNYSPKSPKTPKKGAPVSKKFTFKNVDYTGSKKSSGKSVQGNSGNSVQGNSGKLVQGKKIVSDKLNSSKVSTSDKLKDVKSTDITESKPTREISRNSVDDKGETSKVTDKANASKKVEVNQQHTPVIIDIRDGLPECPAENSVRENKSEKSPKLKKMPSNLEKKKSALQQLSQKISRGSAKTSNLVEKASKNVKSVQKNSKASRINSNTKEPKAIKEGARPLRKGKTEVKGDLRIMSESESNNTAFITGQGWEIKTSCNESKGVIVQDPGTNTAEQSLHQRKLSPANSLKIDFLAKRTPMSPEVINNIANIMSPLEINTPKFMPDTMGTIKEFAGSLSSVEEEKVKAVFTFSPVGSPKVSQNRKKGFKALGKQSSPVKSASPLTQDPQTPGSAFLPPTDDAPSLTPDCKTNPDLLKVFCIPDHFESADSTPRSSPCPSNVGKKSSLDASMDKKQVVTDEMPKGAKQATENRRRSLQNLQKPATSSKFGLSKSLRKYLKRRQSAPAEVPSSDEDSSDADSCASFKSRLRLLADIADVGSDDSSVDGRVSSRTKRSATGRDKIENKEKNEDVDTKIEGASDKDEDRLKSSSKEQLLTEHVQTISIKTLQELNTILSNSEEAPITSPLAPPLSSRPISRESMYSRPKTQSSLNQSLPLSEASEGLDLNLLDNLRQDSYLSGELINTTGRGTTLSSATSGDRSQSQSTNLSESEGELLHWKKGNVLGKGAFGTVFCGLTSTGQLIAVKQVELTEKRQAGEQYEKLQEEVELLKTLRHKNIVGFLGVSLEESVVNIFMQYVPGGSIASLLARFGALEEAVFCRYTQQVVEGTVYLHSNNVIHRDIKGANIMLMSNGVIKLIDFGCAKRLCIQISQSQNLLKSMKGTPYWMAPEVIMETGHGTKSDVWSIGCTVMEMATRKPPWADMPPMSAIFAIGSGGPVPQLSDKFSTAARDFVDLCLTRNPDERATSLELLQHPFLKQRKDRRKDSRLHSRTSLSNFEEGIMFKEQPILKDTADSSRKKTIFEDFK